MFTYSFGDCDDQIELKTTWCAENLEYIVDDAAKDFYENHDGWESSWPNEIVIFEDGKELGIFTVELEHEPTFSSVLKET